MAGPNKSRREFLGMGLPLAAAGGAAVLGMSSPKPVSRSNINELLDVLITNPALWDRLVYDGTNWVNKNPRTLSTLVDEFMAGTIEDGEIGELGWASITSGGSVLRVSGVAQHPGIFSARTGTGINTYQGFSVGGMNPGDERQCLYLVRGLTNSGVLYRTGIAGSIATFPAPLTTAIYYRFDSSTDTNWMAVIADDTGVESEFNTTVPFVANQWFILRIVKKPSTIEFWIDDVLRITATDGFDAIFPTGPAAFQTLIRNLDGVGGVKSYHHDLFTAEQTVTR